MKKLFYILLFLLSSLFYWGTSLFIQNRTEAEDAYEYAMMAESTSHDWYLHPHHVLYGPFARGGYRALQLLGYEGRAFPVLTWFSSVAAAGSLFFFFMFCYRRFSLRPVSSLLATGLLAVSYGFWRYAAEAEIVLPASLLVLAALYYATDESASRSAFLLALVFSVLAVLMHIMNAVAVFLAIPGFYLLRHRWKAAAVHIILNAVALIIIFAAIQQTHSLFDGSGTRFVGIGLGSFVKALVALCQCVISADFMLGFRSIRAFLQELFAARMLSEEFYLGERLPRLLVLFSLLSYLLFIAVGAACIARAGWLWRYMVHHRERFQLPSGMATIWVALIWFFGYAALLLCIEPGNPELWVMGLTPFWLIFCGLVLLPLTVDNRLWLPFLLAFVLFIHNGAGGIGVLGDPDKDYQYRKSRWILQHASSRDAVITGGGPVFERYLRYHFDGTVMYLYGQPDAVLKEGRLPVVDGDIYVMGDVFSPIKSLRVRYPAKSEFIDLYALSIEKDAVKVVDNEFGGIFRIEGRHADADTDSATANKTLQ